MDLTVIYAVGIFVTAFGLGFFNEDCDDAMGLGFLAIFWPLGALLAAVWLVLIAPVSLGSAIRNWL